MFLYLVIFGPRLTLLKTRFISYILSAVCQLEFDPDLVLTCSEIEVCLRLLSSIFLKTCQPLML